MQLCDCHTQWEQEAKGKEHEYAVKVGKAEPSVVAGDSLHLQIAFTRHQGLIHHYKTGGVCTSWDELIMGEFGGLLEILASIQCKIVYFQ